jgi:murein biosynthesis integral membrane protein MurJ
MIRKILKSLYSNEIIKASLILSLITCFIKLAGYIEKVLLAYYWGTGNEADAYNAIFTFIISILVFFREIIEPGFLNVFLKAKQESGKKEAWKVFFSVFWCIFPVAVLISLLLFCYSDFITRLVLPGFSGERFSLSGDLMKAASLSCVFIILSTLTNITLNAYKRFTIAAWGDLAFKFVLILFILFFANKSGIYAAIYGMVVGSIIRLAVHFFALSKNTKPAFFSFKSGYLQKIWLISWPLLIGIIFSQISSLVDNAFASCLQKGSLSALSYAKKIVELPIVIFPYALSIVLFPHFSQLHIEKNILRIRDLLRTTFRWIAVIFIPLAVITFLFSDNIIRLIFQRGAFDAASTLLTARPLAVYSLGMPAFAIETVLVIAFFALSDTKTPVFTGIACVIINIAVTWILIQTIGYSGIAWGFVASKSLKVIFLLYLLKNKFQKTQTGL